MKLNVMGYEIEIKGKMDFEKKEFQEINRIFLNDLSIALGEAGNWNQFNGSDVVAKKYFKASKDIYNYLLEEGFYRGDM